MRVLTQFGGSEHSELRSTRYKIIDFINFSNQCKITAETNNIIASSVRVSKHHSVEFYLQPPKASN